jgi:tRNA nucleotidyltransferase (CCA-adding enzyme)
MARSADGRLIDPYGGQADLRARRLRHVSAAFTEDPVRILRVARFAARFAELGFEVAPETLALMQGMVVAGEVRALVPERVWRELERALRTTRPERFFQVLQECGALPAVLPEIDSLILGAGAPPDALAVLRAAANQLRSGPVRWAAMLAALDEPTRKSLAARLRTPSEYAELATLSGKLHHTLVTDAARAQAILGAPARLLEVLETADAFRRPDRFTAWLDVLAARATAAHWAALLLAKLLAQLHDALARCAQVRLPAEELATLHGPQIAARLRQRRIEVLQTSGESP